MSSDEKDTQPRRNRPQDEHRHYIHAEWKPAGSGGGHPKISGGLTVDNNGEIIDARAFNRPDQRYTQPAATITANRVARAAAELSGTVILQGAGSLIELRAISGNNYDLNATGTGCDCPDQLRLDESYGPGLQCKHSHMAQTQLTTVGGYSNLPWSCSRLAEALGIDETTAQKLCARGEVSATKVHNVWVIGAGSTRDTEVAAYLAKVIGHPVIIDPV